MYGGGCGIGLIMIVLYGVHRLKLGIKNQNDTDSIVGILCLLGCVAIVVLGVMGKL